jgi:hypothetical protein
MHELSLCESVLQVIEQQAQVENYQTVTAVYLEIGAFHPFKYSNTATLRDVFGWIGCSVDPSSEAYKAFFDAGLSERFVNWTSQQQGRVVLPKINQNALNKIPVPTPSINEQKEIVRRVESLFALADTVEKQYLAAKQRLDRLSQSLLAKAFRGELVPQDPNDEPAAELLKRIQAERQAQPAPKQKRSKPA